MHIDAQDRALREAGGNLTKAMRALQDAGFPELSRQTLTLANNVLRARRELGQPLSVEGR